MAGLETDEAADSAVIATATERAHQLLRGAEIEAEAVVQRASDRARLAAFETGIGLRRLLLSEGRRLQSSIGELKTATAEFEAEVVATKADLRLILERDRTSPQGAAIKDSFEGLLIASADDIDAWLATPEEQANDHVVLPELTAAAPPPRPQAHPDADAKVVPPPPTRQRSVPPPPPPPPAPVPRLPPPPPRAKVRSRGRRGTRRSGRSSRAVARATRISNVAKRRRWRSGLVGLRSVGLLLVAFSAFQLYGTSAVAQRSQQELRDEFHSREQIDESVVSSPPVAVTSGAENAVPAAPVAHPTSKIVKAGPGHALAELTIPRIGLDVVVVEGTSAADLRRGPGHYRGSSLPGQNGNAAIAGHRTTYGAPFSDLDKLVVGDAINVTTPAGAFVYKVIGAEVVSPDVVSVLDDHGDSRLTLTTCHPRNSAKQRLVVSAPLQPSAPGQANTAAPTVGSPPNEAAMASHDAVANEGGQPAATTATRDVVQTALMRDALAEDQDDGWLSDRAAFWPFGGFGVLLFGGWWLCKRVLTGAGYPMLRWLTAPLFLFGLIPWFESITRLLPPNY
jgi:sortase A